MARKHQHMDLYKDLYLNERYRREQTRQSVSTPVAALAFSVFNLGTLATNFDPDIWGISEIVIAILACISIISLIVAAILIIKVEAGIYYYDPPNLEEMMKAEHSLRESSVSDDEFERKMSEYLVICYDIAYRRYFHSNEQAAYFRTTGMHLIVIAMVFISLAYLFLPF